MSRRGSYLGGHTVVGPRSGWFSFSKGGKPKQAEHKSQAEEPLSKKTQRKKKRLNRQKERDNRLKHLIARQRTKSAKRIAEVIFGQGGTEALSGFCDDQAARLKLELDALRAQHASEIAARQSRRMARVIVELRQIEPRTAEEKRASKEKELVVSGSTTQPQPQETKPKKRRRSMSKMSNRGGRQRSLT